MRAASGSATPISTTARPQTRLLFAPFFALTGVGAALLVAWAMLGTARIELIVGWLALVGFANWTYCRRASTEGAAAESRSAEGRPLVRRDRRGGRPRRHLVRASRPTPSPPSRTRSRS